jgi:hypothetical protein
MSNRLSRTLASIRNGLAIIVGTAGGLATGFMLAFAIWNLA